MTRLSRFAAAPSAAAVLAALCFLAWPLLAGAQGGRTEVTIDHTQQAVLKTDVRIGDFRALSAGRNVQETAAKLREVVANDLLLSGLFNVGGVGSSRRSCRSAGPSRPRSKALPRATGR
jgi:hypothetical protein